jgi:putative transposase
VQIDHTLVDIQLVDDLTREPLGRPWLTLLLDVCTRCVVGFTVSLDPPSAAGVGLAMAQGVLPKSEWLNERHLELAWPMLGIPQQLHLDNGREFHSRALERGCQQYGIEIDYRPPGKPRFGGHIERLMGTFMQRVHALPGSTSSNVVERGDYPSEKKAVLTLDEFDRIFALGVLGPYHNDLHSELGKTPAAAWTEGIAATGNPRMPPNPKEFVWHFLPFEERIIGRPGIRLFNIKYFDSALVSVLDGADRKRRVKYNPRDMSTVYVEMSDGSHLPVRYADLRRPPISLWEHRRAVRSLKEQGRATIDEAAIFQAIEEQRRILDQAKAASKTARRDIARLPRGEPENRSGIPPQGQNGATTRPRDDKATVPKVIEEDAWKTRFFS